MFPYVVSISITDSTGSDKQLFHTDLYNYMPYFSAGMPDIKILLLAVRLIFSLKRSHGTQKIIVYFLGTFLPLLIGSFHWNIIHSMKQKTITFFSRCDTFPDHFIKQIQKRIVLQPGLFDSIQKLPDTSRFSPGFRNPVILQLFVGLCL